MKIFSLASIFFARANQEARVILIYTAIPEGFLKTLKQQT